MGKRETMGCRKIACAIVVWNVNCRVSGKTDCMQRKIKKRLAYCRRLERAIFGLRLFTGCALFVHVIGKLQVYNEIVESYPSILYIDSAASFIIITAIEALLATLLILGFKVRMAAAVLAFGIVLQLFWGSWALMMRNVAWLGISVFFVVAGGGIYSIEYFAGVRQREKRDFKQD